MRQRLILSHSFLNIIPKDKKPVNKTGFYILVALRDI
jgi:hypothetical protein